VRALELDEIAELAKEPSQEPELVRRLRLILIDEAHYKLEAWNAEGRFGGDWQPFRLPLNLNPGTDLPIGEIERVVLKRPGEVPGTVGHVLLGDATLANTALADIAFQAVVDSVYTNICCELFYFHPEQLALSGAERPIAEPSTSPRYRMWILGANLTPAEGAHMPTCRILEAW
jgi:hypothetical protein